LLGSSGEESMELEKIPSLIAVATFAALSMTVAHEWGYFGVIGTEFQSFFTTYDYISELLVLIGPSFVALLVMIAVQVSIVRSDDFKPKTLGDAFTAKWGKFIGDWFYELSWGVLLVLTLLFIDETRRNDLYILLALLWVRVIFYIFDHSSLVSFKRTPVGLLLQFLPAGMIVMYGYGRDGAYSDLQQAKPEYRLQLKNKEVSQHVAMLRIFDKGALVFDPATQTIAFRSRDDISSLERDRPKWETQSFACRRWGWRCLKAGGSSTPTDTL
jgi:hypothetical protein